MMFDVRVRKGLTWQRQGDASELRRQITRVDAVRCHHGLDQWITENLRQGHRFVLAAEVDQFGHRIHVFHHWNSSLRYRSVTLVLTSNTLVKQNAAPARDRERAVVI
jgi:hypothetical protein